MSEPSLSITSAHDLLNAVPFLLGFHPTASVVVISLRDDNRRVGLTVRLDDPAPGTDLTVIADRLAMHLLDDGADSAVLVIYRDGITERSREPLLEALSQALAEHEIALHDALIVSGNRWWSLVCRDACCPDEGKPVPDFSTSVIAAEHVLHGLPLPMRSDAELRESLGPVDTDLAQRVAHACAIRRDVVNRETIVEGDGNRMRTVRRRHIEMGADAVDRIFGAWVISGLVASLDVEDLAQMLVGMNDVHVRDYAMGMHSDHQLEQALSLWRALLPIAPPGCIAPVATVLAAVAFEHGDGVLAQRAIDCAFDDRLNYPMAALLRQAMEAGWSPSAMTSMRKELRSAVVATVRAA